MTATTLPVGARVRPTTATHGPGVITHLHHGWATVRHDNGQDVDWFLWALEVSE